MTNTTPIYWEFNGVSLSTLQWNVSTFGGRRNTPPIKRGEDTMIPHRRGRRSTKKYRESRILPLPMYILPVQADGTSPGAGTTYEQQLHANWLTLINALDTDGQAPFVKRWFNESGSVVSASGLAEVVEPPEPQHDGGYRYSFDVGFLMADPYFYGSEVSASPGAVTIQGNATTDRITINMDGGTNPKVTLPDGNWVQYVGTPSNVSIDLYEGLALSGGSTVVNGLVNRNPLFTEWGELGPGAGTISLTGGGTVSVDYLPAYK